MKIETKGRQTPYTNTELAKVQAERATGMLQKWLEHNVRQHRLFPEPIGVDLNRTSVPPIIPSLGNE